MKALVIAFVTAVTGTAALCEVPVAALQTAAAYSESFNAYDCDALIALTTPQARKGRERSENGESLFCQVIAEFKSEGVRERLRAPSASVSQGPYRMVFVPSRRSGVDPRTGIPAVTDGTYVVHSSDSGRTWFVLDLGCLDDRWLKAVYPPYDGTPEVPPTTVRLLSWPSTVPPPAAPVER